MKTKQLRQISLILAALTAAGTMLACGDAAEKTPADDTLDTTPQTEVITEDPLKPDLPEDLNYDGYTFRVYMRKTTPNTMISEESTGDTMDDAVYERNMVVSEALNVTFENIYQEGDSNAVNAKTAIMANEDAYDLVLPHARFTFTTYAMNGLSYDWYELPYVDLDKPYWYQDAKESFTIVGRLFSMVGDIDTGCLGATKCMYFNKQIMTDYDLESPYELVNSGKWTLDKFTEQVRSVKQDLNGDSTIEITKDQLGYATSWWGGPINVLYAGNQRVCRINDDGEIYLTLNSERTVELYDKYFSLFDGDDCYIQLADGGSDIGNAFKEGRLYIQDGNLGSAEGLRDMDIDFGIIPWPKLDESEKEYRTGVDAGCNMLLVPISVSDVERTSAIIELMCYQGNKIMIPAYYDIALQTKAARDEDSSAMMDIIRASGLYDVGYYCNTDVKFLGSCGYSLCKRADHNFASYYAEAEQSSLAAIEKINQTFAQYE